MNVPYLVMRDGRPRWHPNAKLLARGFKGRDLRYAEDHDRAGQWMAPGDAMEAARAINETTKGEPPAAPAIEDRSFGGLFERLRASPKFREVAAEGEDIDAPRKVGLEKLKIKPRTRADYLRQMKILEQWCGDIQIRDLSPDMVEEFYHDQAESSLAQANHLMRAGKMATNYAIKRLRWTEFNPFSAIKMADPDGRLEIFERDQIAAILAAADWCGLPSIGDAFVIGILGGPRKQDILVLPEGEISASHYVIRQLKKKGARAFVPITQALLSRVTAMRARKAKSFPGVRHTLEIINSRTGLPYPKNAKAFGEDWRMVRAVAAGDAEAIAEARRQRDARGVALPELQLLPPVPSLARMLFSDTRDTAVTYLAMAGCTVPEIANTSGHSLKTVQAILDKHYFKRNAELASIVGNKLDAYLATSTIRWA